jgi:hypothetical protein
LSRQRFFLCSCRATAAFLVVPVLPSSSHRRFCLRRRAAGSAFVVAPPFLPSSSGRRFCLRRRAAAAFLVAQTLPSLWRRRFLF